MVLAEVQNETSHSLPALLPSVRAARMESLKAKQLSFFDRMEKQQAKAAKPGSTPAGKPPPSTPKTPAAPGLKITFKTPGQATPATPLSAKGKAEKALPLVSACVAVLHR